MHMIIEPEHYFDRNSGFRVILALKMNLEVHFFSKNTTNVVEDCNRVVVALLRPSRLQHLHHLTIAA